MVRNSAVYAVPEAAGAGRLVTKAWHLTAVTVREGTGRAELAALCRVSHPGILLLMAVSPGPQDQLQLVFQHVPLGPLHHWLHVQVRHTYRWKLRNEQRRFTITEKSLKTCQSLMICASAIQLHIYLPWADTSLA